MIIRNRKFNNIPKIFHRSCRLLSSAQSNPVVANTATQESKIQQLINADKKENNPVPVFKKAFLNTSKIAIKDVNGEKLYSDLVTGSFKLSKQISDVCGKWRH